MVIQTSSPPKSSSKIRKYGLLVEAVTHPLQVEMHCIRKGGKWITASGKEAGEGLFFHYRRGQEILWPEKRWHKWREMSLQAFAENTYAGEMGAAACGKSDDAATDFLFDWYCFPECTTVLVSSTDLQSLDLRVWGMIKRHHRAAKENVKWIPGHLIEGARRIIQDQRSEFIEGRDFKNGVLAVPCKRGQSFVGLGPLIGIHNKRVHMIGDELQLMPRSFIDSIANLSKCEHFRFRGIGNPNDTANAHGFICEPAMELGGWEGGIDQRPGTKTWKTRMPNGICIQKPGSESPNFDVPEGEEPPFPFLMTRQQMKDDAQIWGVDDWHYTMMNEARMPRGQGSRRVLTRQMCERFGATTEPIWRDTRKTSITFLDAAFRGTGGDRCVFGELQFGLESSSTGAGVNDGGALAAQSNNSPQGRIIIALIDLVIIPINAEKGADEAEDQIVKFVIGECDRREVPATNFFYDAGMRTTLVSAFSRLNFQNAEPVDCGGKPSEDMVSAEIQKRCCDYYSKKITQMWYDVRLCVESRQFRGLTQDAMWEFCAREFKQVSGNRIELESKEDMKKKTGKSPDLADSIAVGIFGARKRGFIISKLGKNLPANRGREDWKKKLLDRAKEIREAGQLLATN